MRLDIATRRWHAAVDEPWLDLLHPSVSPADYSSLLARTYGFVGPFEAACKYTPAFERSPLAPHTRAGLIAQDLLALGLTPSQVATVPQCHSITTFRGVREAMGWLYVVRRSAVLHERLHRHLRLHLPEVKHACAYLSASDHRDGEPWTTFGRMVDRLGTRPEVASEIIGAAQAGFATMREWFRGTHSYATSAV